MWNLKYDIDELIYKTETDIQNRPVVAKGEVGICSYNLLSIEWINNKVLLYSTGNYIQYPMINHNGKEDENNIDAYNWIYLCITHFAVQKKLIHPYKATML